MTNNYIQVSLNPDDQNAASSQVDLANDGSLTIDSLNVALNDVLNGATAIGLQRKVDKRWTT
jgi:hypothetical protein